MGNPEISVVIRTFNEEKFLSDLLDSLGQQSIRNVELIVVDSGSLDRTREIAAQKADQLLDIQSHDFTFGYSLNIGVESANGKYIAIVSAHTLPTDDQWLKKLIDPLREKKTAMVYGRQLGASTSKFSEIQDMRRTFGSQQKVMRPPRFFANNANSAIRKDLWQGHPFDESLPGLEDIEWAKYWMERGYNVLYEPLAALYHIHEESWRQVRRRYYREALAARWIGIKTVRHALITPFVEAARIIFDLGGILLPRHQSSKAARNVLDLIKETILFRTNKSVGTVRGLLDGGAMETPNVRESIFFDRTGRAVVIRGPQRASLEEIEIPEIKPGEVLIRVAYEAICATDLEIYDGTLGYYKNGVAKYPIIPGHEFSGRVVACGPNVNHVHEGELAVVECIQSCGVCPECRRDNWIACQGRTELGVIGRNGGYSEYVAVPGRFVHGLAPDYDLQKACLCEPLAVVLKGLGRLERTGSANPKGKRCAVLGAGPLGNLCAQTMDIKGHQVTVFDRSPARLEYFSDSAIQTSDDLARLKEFDVLVEVTGDPDALDAMLHRSMAGATILLLGLPYAHRKFTFESIVAFDKTVVGSVGSTAQDFDDAIALLPQLNTAPFTEQVMPLSEFLQAWELARTQKYLKLILKIS